MATMPLPGMAPATMPVQNPISAPPSTGSGMAQNPNFVPTAPRRMRPGPDTSQSTSVSPGMTVQGQMPTPKNLQGGFQGYDDPQQSAYKKGGKVKKPRGVGKAMKGHGKGKMR